MKFRDLASEFYAVKFFDNLAVKELCFDRRGHHLCYVLHGGYVLVEITVVSVHHAARVPVEDSVALDAAVRAVVVGEENADLAGW